MVEIHALEYFHVMGIQIIIIIFSFYTALITNVSKRFTNILLPRSLDSVLGHAHTVCKISTPWGAFQPGVT